MRVRGTNEMYPFALSSYPKRGYSFRPIPETRILWTAPRGETCWVSRCSYPSRVRCFRATSGPRKTYRVCQTRKDLLDIERLTETHPAWRELVPPEIL